MLGGGLSLTHALFLRLHGAATLLLRRADGRVSVRSLGTWKPRLTRNFDGTVTVER